MKLADICDINPKAEVLDDYTLVSFVAMPDVSEDGRINVGTHRTYGEVKKVFTNFKEGDVLFAKITPCMENGKGALTTGLENGLGFGSTEFHVLRPNPALVLGQWLYYLTSWSAFRKDAEKHMTGSAGQKRVPKSFLEKYEVDVPPIDDQKYQVLQLNRIRKIIDARRQQLSALDDLIKARFVEMFGDPVTNPKKFETRLGADVFKLSNGKYVPEAKRFEYGIPVYGGNGISWYTDEILYGKDTIVVGRVGFQSGNVHFVKGPLWISDNAMYVSNMIDDGFDLRFLYYVMEHIDFTRFQDAGDLKKITQKPFMQMHFIKPPTSMQQDYNSYITQIDKSKSVIQKSLDETQLLFDSLMQEYFG